MAVESPPWAEQGATGYNAEQTRRAVFFGITTPGVKTQGAWLMSAPGLMTVANAAGEGIIPGTLGSTQGDYYGLATSSTTTAVAAASAVNPRVDLNAAVDNDVAYGGGTNAWAFEVVTGTPTAGATLANLNGAPALPASSLLIGYILVPASASSIVAADLLDKRVLYGPPPDPVPVSETANFNAVSGSFYEVNATSGAVTGTLPPPTANQVVAFTKADTSANALTINASTNSGLIVGPGCNGVNSILLGAVGSYVVLVADGANWVVTAGAQDSGWLAFSYANSWASNSGPLGPGFAAYRKIGNLVRLGGTIKSGASGNSWATLPAGYRPPYSVQATNTSYASTQDIDTLYVTTAGVCTAWLSAGTAVGIDMSFTVD